MSEVTQYNAVLKEYFDGENSIADKMLNIGYLNKPAKSAGFEGKHSKDYHIDQSLYTHLVNGIFAITRLLGYITHTSPFQLTEEDFRTVLAIFTMHDIHKIPTASRGSEKEFDVNLEAFQEEGEALGLFDFARVTVEQMRPGMMHLNKKMVGDLSKAPPGTARLISIVRLADTLASIHEPSEYRGLATDLAELSPHLIGRYKFYHHELHEYRGLSTQLLHQCLSEYLRVHFQCYPLLYFANGVMYIGPSSGTSSVPTLTGDIIANISRGFFAKIQQSMQKVGRTVAESALNPQQTVKFQQYVYLFSDVPDLLDTLASYAPKKAQKLIISDLIEKRSEKRPSFAKKYPSPDAFCERYNIDPEAERDADYAAKWGAVSQYIRGVESIARDMLGEGQALPWIFDNLQTPIDVQTTITADINELKSGGVTDYNLIIAYHYLRSQSYRKGFSARAVEIQDILEQLQEQITPALQQIVTVDSRQNVVDQELALTSDLHAYLTENLECSHPAFEKFIPQPGAVFTEYQKRRTAGHQHLCVLCSRVIPTEMHDATIKTGILEDQALVFSNKLVPRSTVGSQMVWCPMCYLEFTLRQLNGLGYTSGADSTLSDRLYLYLFPDLFFTPEHVAHMKRVFDMFEQQTGIKLRQYGKDDQPSLPTLWMRSKQFNAKMRNAALNSLKHEAERLDEEVLDDKKRPTGRKRKDRPGDRIRSSHIEALNYRLIVYEKSTSQSAPELAATRSELWGKGIYTALVAYLLLGVRVYVTDKPYLTISDVSELTHIITLDAPHTLLRELLAQSGKEAFIRLSPLKGGRTEVTVQDAMDAFSALWIVNECLTSGNTGGKRRNLDKQVASLLSEMNSNPLAGAAFYKERQRDELPATPEFTMACTYLLRKIGGWKLDLAERLAHQSLAIFLPSIKDTKGKANQYERLYRLALESLKKMSTIEDASEMKFRIAGALEKAVMRQEEMNKGGRFVGKMNCDYEELKQRASDFAETIVQELFIKRCGRNISKLITEENSLADGIFFVTDCELANYWHARRQRINDRKSAAGQNDHDQEEETIEEMDTLLS
jgi:hypothetical protein